MTRELLAEWLVQWGDDALVLGQRLGEWCGHGPVLEEDIALTNLALDLIGQARWLLTRSGECEGKGRTEDDLAYFRTDRQFRNHLLVEQPNGDFAVTLVRHLFYAEFAVRKAESVAQTCNDADIAAFGRKAATELKYHVAHAREWVIRLGDGTAESRRRTQEALVRLAPFCGELFDDTDVDRAAAEAGICPLPSLLRAPWEAAVASCIEEAGVLMPEVTAYQRGGKVGKHTEHLSYLLAEMQVLQRTYPGATW